MKARVVDKKTGDVVYEIEILGNPYNPDSIKESGSRKEEFQQLMAQWYESSISFTKKMVDGMTSKVSYHLTLIYNVADEEKYDTVVEDYPDHTKYPEYVKHIPKRHGGAFEFEVF